MIKPVLGKKEFYTFLNFELFLDLCKQANEITYTPFHFIFYGSYATRRYLAHKFRY